MMEFKDKWDSVRLYIICNNFLNNQTEENALKLIKQIEDYKNKYCYNGK